MQLKFLYKIPKPFSIQKKNMGNFARDGAIFTKKNNPQTDKNHILIIVGD